MALQYISLPEIKAFVGAKNSANDTILTILGESAELFFTNKVNWIITEHTVTDEIHRPEDYDIRVRGKVLWLRAYAPTEITSISGITLGTAGVDYDLVGRRLELKSWLNMPTTFPFYWKITYTAGLTTVPSDIKMALLYIVNAMWKKRQSEGIQMFRQDLLHVQYQEKGTLEILTDPNERSFVESVTDKYTIPVFYVT